MSISTSALHFRGSMSTCRYVKAAMSVAFAFLAIDPRSELTLKYRLQRPLRASIHTLASLALSAAKVAVCVLPVSGPIAVRHQRPVGCIAFRNSIAASVSPTGAVVLDWAGVTSDEDVGSLLKCSISDALRLHAWRERGAFRRRRPRRAFSCAARSRPRPRTRGSRRDARPIGTGLGELAGIYHPVELRLGHADPIEDHVTEWAGLLDMARSILVQLN